MKKKLLLRGLLGVPLGIAIGHIITVIVSLCIGDGLFYPVRPELVGAMRGELNAVLLQTALCGIMGAGFAMASVIWEIDSWSLAKQSGIYFAIAGILSYAGIFAVIFVLVWLIQYFVWKRKVRRMNERIRGSGDGE